MNAMIDGNIVRQSANELKILVNEKFNDKKKLEIFETKTNETIVPDKTKTKRASRIFIFLFTILIIVALLLYPLTPQIYNSHTGYITIHLSKL